jgi:hypothetical protein
METRPALAQDSVLILSCDGDATLGQGDWLRFWNPTGMGIAHDVWVGIGGIVYENSGPGGFVRRNTLANVLAGRKVIHIVARTAPADTVAKLYFAESRSGTLWSVFYNCQDFASEVVTGRPQSFQREGLGQLGAVAHRRFSDARNANQPSEECAGHLSNAAEYIQKALEMLPENAVNELVRIHNQLGMIRGDSGYTEKALRHFHDSVRRFEAMQDRFGSGPYPL